MERQAAPKVRVSPSTTVPDNVAAIDPQAILQKVASMPVAEWNYKAEAASVRHIGPMAQDFAAAFGLGEDDKHIATVDADGVALAAIQALNAKVETITAENAQLKQEVATLKQSHGMSMSDGFSPSWSAVILALGLTLGSLTLILLSSLVLVWLRTMHRMQTT